MANTYKVLAQQEMSTANNPYDAYTVPSNTETVISTISICNRGSTATTYTFGVRVDGEFYDNKQYIAYNAPIQPYESIFLTLGVTMDAGDIFLAMSTSGNLSLSLFGSEMS
tara:strand:+ start:361 stop:693 length:333 start_codon:yes stop_codon:yes gene_type:complete